MQNHYNMIYREEEREMFPTLKVSIAYHRLAPLLVLTRNQMFGVGSIPWSPLARGLLSRPIDQQSLRGDTDW